MGEFFSAGDDADVAEVDSADDDDGDLQVKDARSGPGLKSMTRIKSRQVGSEVAADYVASRVCDVATVKHRSESPRDAKLHTVSSRSAGSLYRIGNSSSMFIDSDYWTP